MFLHSSITIVASGSESKASTESTSVADAGGKGFHERVLPGRAWLDVGSAGVADATPVSERVRGQLGVVVHADELQWSAARRNDPLEHGDGAVGVDSPLDLDRERLPSVLVDDVQQLEDAAILGRVDLEVERPHPVRPAGAEPRRLGRRAPEPVALATRRLMTLRSNQTSSVTSRGGSSRLPLRLPEP